MRVAPGFRADVLARKTSVPNKQSFAGFVFYISKPCYVRINFGSSKILTHLIGYIRGRVFGTVSEINIVFIPCVTLALG